jgi:predicted RNase H-like HicB family nuclease
MELRLTAVYEEVPNEEGGGYVAYVEELPGAISQGTRSRKRARTCAMPSNC